MEYYVVMKKITLGIALAVYAIFAAASPPPPHEATAKELKDSVEAEYAKWQKLPEEKKAFYATGHGGPSANGKTDQTWTTTQAQFTTAFGELKDFFTKENPKMYIRSALSKGENFEATDIIVSSDINFKNGIPKMVFHVWGKFN